MNKQDNKLVDKCPRQRPQEAHPQSSLVLYSESINRSMQDIRDREKRMNMAFGHIEEGNKLNLLIDEYRKENDRCSNRLQELQQKL